MNIICNECKEEFTASEEQSSLILNSQKKGMKFIMLECLSCYASFSLNPQTMEIPTGLAKTEGDDLRCPCDSCSGLISFVEDKKSFWGCGECATVWFTLPDLFQAIADSIRKHPYRARVYMQKGDRFLPVPFEDEPKNYEEAVGKE